mgnify:CR=1 FL=1
MISLPNSLETVPDYKAEDYREEYSLKSVILYNWNLCNPQRKRCNYKNKDKASNKPLYRAVEHHIGRAQYQLLGILLSTITKRVPISAHASKDLKSEGMEISGR